MDIGQGIKKSDKTQGSPCGAGAGVYFPQFVIRSRGHEQDCRMKRHWVGFHSNDAQAQLETRVLKE